MARRRLFLEHTTVLDAARKRIRHVYDTFDTVAVQFSGGKDSTAVLYLAKEVHDERGLGPVKTIFRDEEMVSPSVERFVTEVANYDWVDMEWYCLPMAQEIWVLGIREYVLLWSEQRQKEGRLVRPIPAGAITAKHFGLPEDRPVPQPVDYYTMQGKEGMTAFLTGVRANESMIRYRAVTQKLHENYINRPYGLSKAIPMRFAKIIYDWTSDDVMKYIVDERQAPYCEFYDYADLSGANPRVGIPLHSIASRRISDVLTTEPEFFDRLVTAFPQIDAQHRLWKDFDTESLIESYSQDGMDGVRDCIDDNMLSESIAKAAMKFVAKYRKKQANDPYGYPTSHLIRTLLLNEFHHSSPSPVGPKTRSNTVRILEQEMIDANSLDILDDTR